MVQNGCKIWSFLPVFSIFCFFSPDLWMEYRIFISIVDISANLENIDIDIDKAIPKISISMSIRLFWKISISISISIGLFWKISISISIGHNHSVSVFCLRSLVHLLGCQINWILCWEIFFVYLERPPPIKKNISWIFQHGQSVTPCWKIHKMRRKKQFCGLCKRTMNFLIFLKNSACVKVLN